MGVLRRTLPPLVGGGTAASGRSWGVSARLPRDGGSDDGGGPSPSVCQHSAKDLQTLSAALGDVRRLDQIISNIITTGKSMLADLRPHGDTEERGDAQSLPSVFPTLNVPNAGTLATRLKVQETSAFFATLATRPSVTGGNAHDAGGGRRGGHMTWGRRGGRPEERAEPPALRTRIWSRVRRPPPLLPLAAGANRTAPAAAGNRFSARRRESKSGGGPSHQINGA